MAFKTDLKIIPFKSSIEFEKWLEKNHTQTAGIWIQIFKKESGKKTISYAEALDAVLCYGWIDGQKRSYDEKSWLQKFTPRRPRSGWSCRNTEHVERLLKAKRIQAAGLKQIEEAKKDGRWAQAYDSPSTMTLPKDFFERLAKNKKAKTFFETLNKSNRYAIAYRLQTAVKPETKEKRTKDILAMLARGEAFHFFKKPEKERKS